MTNYKYAAPTALKMTRAARLDDWLDHLFAEGFPVRRVKYGRTGMSPSRGRYFTRQDAENGNRDFALPKPISFWNGRLGQIAFEYAEIVMQKKISNSTTTPDFDLDYFKRLINESDRGCVLLTASRMDELLKELHVVYIKSKTSPKTKLVKDLFAIHAPLSTLSAKIKLAFGYGLICKEDCDDLERLRDMRNKAAHTTEEFAFRQPEIRNKIVAFTAPKRLSQEFPLLKLSAEQREAIIRPSEDEHSTKLCLLVASMYLNLILMDKILKILRTDTHVVSRQQSTKITA